MKRTTTRTLLTLLLALTLLLGLPVTAFAQTASAAEAPPEAQPLPDTSVLTSTDNQEVGPLRIHGPEDYPTYIKIYRYNATAQTLESEPTKTVFLRAGKTLTLQMPRGNFLVRYCNGETWYGEEHMFGDDGAYGEADHFFDFNQQGAGFEITLKLVADGNLATKRVEREKF